MANRKDIIRRISDKTGYYMQDIEEILNAEAESIYELLKEGNDRIKHHKFYQIEVETREPKEAWDGLNKRYFQIPEKKYVKFRPMSELEKVIKDINEEE